MKKKSAAAGRTLARQVADHHAKLSYNQVPAGSRHAMKRLLLDYIGVAIAGSQTESGVIAREFATLQGKALEATLIGGGERVPVTAASFANAISCHSIELDDIDVLALFHFSPPVFSSALALAEATAANGKDLIAALAAGCEVMERVSMAANNDLRNRAFHTTPTCGVFGATVAAGKLLKLTPEQMTSAFGLAGAQASGLMEMYGPSMQNVLRVGAGSAVKSIFTFARVEVDVIDQVFAAPCVAAIFAVATSIAKARTHGLHSGVAGSLATEH